MEILLGDSNLQGRNRCGGVEETVSEEINARLEFDETKPTLLTRAAVA